ncbi:VOC family protein [Streptacidiphilus sp. PAMC 29251]
MIRWTYAYIDRPADRFAEAAEFWTAVTGTRLSDRRGEHGEFATLLAPDADACLKLQAVGDAGGAHPDLAVDDVAATSATALGLGATVVGDHGDWTVLRSPGGQLFCLVPWQGEATRPVAAEAPDGSSSRLDQLALDIAPAAYAAEVAFWAELTGWESLPGSLPEFHVLRPPAALPVRFLLQRLDVPRPAGAHLDLACSDREAVRARHESLGAHTVGRGPHWIVMADPAGGSYCLTGRSPATGGLPPR